MRARQYSSVTYDSFEHCLRNTIKDRELMGSVLVLGSRLRRKATRLQCRGGNRRLLHHFFNQTPSRQHITILTYLVIDSIAMISSDLQARLRYLDAAANLLSVAAPQTSRHLRFKHGSISFDHGIDRTEEQRMKACGACGTAVVPGLEGVLQRKRSPSKKVKKGAPRRFSTATTQPGPMVYTCNSCSRSTEFISTSQPKPPRYKITAGVPLPPKELVNAAPELTRRASPVLASGIKKKTKSTKKSGLAALLAKQKDSSQASSSGFGLNLMDFMKKP